MKKTTSPGIIFPSSPYSDISSSSALAIIQVAFLGGPLMKSSTMPLNRSLRMVL